MSLSMVECAGPKWSRTTLPSPEMEVLIKFYILLSLTVTFLARAPVRRSPGTNGLFVGLDIRSASKFCSLCSTRMNALQSPNPTPSHLPGNGYKARSAHPILRYFSEGYLFGISGKFYSIWGSHISKVGRTFHDASQPRYRVQVPMSPSPPNHPATRLLHSPPVWIWLPRGFQKSHTILIPGSLGGWPF